MWLFISLYDSISNAVLLLIPSTLTQCIFHQTIHSLKLCTSPKCSTLTLFQFHTSGAKKTMKNLSFVDQFRNCNIMFVLSEDIVSENPLLAINLFSALMNSSVVWSGSNSTWIVFVKLHVNPSRPVHFWKFYWNKN